MPMECSPGQQKAKGAQEVFEETFSTPVRKKYRTRIEENYDIETQSPCFEVYKKLHSKVHKTAEPPSSSQGSSSAGHHTGLHMLVDAAFQATQTSSVVTPDIVSLPSTSSCLVSPVLREGSRNIETSPENTVEHFARQSDLNRKYSHNVTETEKITKFTERELNAKVAHLKKTSPNL
ncbi:hypothetical protein DPMN_171183 [Dreissena polymorpha]|uniref:Uncharacterized protein n=1 Tax=Dreissena polymorpha TaxID=45954 RepID=A0A9D4DXJ2_DREPO|nr:hypothetical protein DPMN_171183 [Dreissena polymorpha]